VWPALRVWREHAAAGAHSALAVEEAVATLIAKAAGTWREHGASRRYAAVRKAIEFLHQHSTERFSLFDVATAAGVHATHLARTFRGAMQCTVGTYARRLRILRAVEQLRRCPDWPLSRIALEAGFADHAHCTRTFQAVLGVAPRRLRQALTALQRDCATMRCPQGRSATILISTSPVRG